MLKQAMIFAAGLGTRLRPLTNDRPKALVEINGVTLLEKAILKLKSYGFNRIVVNVHHFADKMLDFLDTHDFGVDIIISDERAELLETGGGLRKAKLFFEDAPILIYNVDILTDLDLNALYDFHVAHNALATLAVRQRATSRYLLFDDNQILHGWTNIKTGITKIRRMPKDDLQSWAFSGIHVIHPQIFSFLERKGAFSIIDTYLACAAKETILAFPHDDTRWLDVGKHESLALAKGFDSL